MSHERQESVDPEAEAALQQAVTDYRMIAKQWQEATSTLRAHGVIETVSTPFSDQPEIQDAAFSLVVGRGQHVTSTGHLNATRKIMAVKIRTAPSLPADEPLEHPSRESGTRWGIRASTQVRGIEEIEPRRHFGWRDEDALRVVGDIMLMTMMQAPGTEVPELYTRYREWHDAEPDMDEIEIASETIQGHARQGLGVLAQITTALSTEQFNPVTPDAPDYLAAAREMAVLVTTAVAASPTIDRFREVSVPSELLEAPRG